MILAYLQYYYYYYYYVINTPRVRYYVVISDDGPAAQVVLNITRNLSYGRDTATIRDVIIVIQQ
jgi:hypothetical protein